MWMDVSTALVAVWKNAALSFNYIGAQQSVTAESPCEITSNWPAKKMELDSTFTATQVDEIKSSLLISQTTLLYFDVW